MSCAKLFVVDPSFISLLVFPVLHLENGEAKEIGDVCTQTTKSTLKSKGPVQITVQGNPK